MLRTPETDTLRPRVDKARARTLAWLDNLAVPEAAPGVTRLSAQHDVHAWPGMLLPGTYNGIHCRALLGGLDAMTNRDRQCTVLWLESHRIAGGAFRIPGMKDDAVYKKPDRDETWRYIDFHVTNYALGAVEMLDGTRVPDLGFLRSWLEPSTFDTWFDRRDWSDPWQEGNNLVNLASFLLLLERFGDGTDRSRAASILGQLLHRLEAIQDPATGFWWDGNENGGRGLLHAMAGAMHSFHLWYARARPLPHQEKAADYTLSLDPAAVLGACLDVDAIDLLFHAERAIGYRTDEIRDWSRIKLETLLDAQRADGGFADVEDGTLRPDGWVGGYAEPQGRSNTFATWFRWIAIAMVAELLWPGWRNWQFRQMIGIGYCRTAFRSNGHG